MEGAIALIHKSQNKTLTLTIDRNGKKFQVKAIPIYNPKLKVALLGFSPKPI